jgi:DNA-binding beta-propeller fold protein YncE
MSLRLARFACLVLATAAAPLAGCSADPEPTPHEKPPLDPDLFLAAPHSCAYACPNDTCAEAKTPYACPALDAWADVPHLDDCPAWDGKYPAATAGHCNASAPSGDALKRPGLSAGVRLLPDGRMTKPSGAEWLFAEKDIQGGTTSAIAAVPDSTWVITVDTGNDDHAVRAVDTAKIGKSDPVTGFLKFSPPSYLNSAVVALPKGRVYVATGYGVVQALSLDLGTGALTRADDESLALPMSANNTPYYAAGLAASPDGKRLVVSGVSDGRVLVLDIDPASPTYKTVLGSVDTGQNDTFGVSFDPSDAAGQFAYVTVWGTARVLEIDLGNPQKPAVKRTFKTDENPQGVAFLDGRWMAVGNDYGETISLVDRVTGDVAKVPVDFEAGLKGLDVSGLAFDPAQKRLYAILSGINAVAAYDVDLAKSPPTLTPAGRLATSWWPSGLVVHPDGGLSLVNMRGSPIGAQSTQKDVGDGGFDVFMRGSVQHVPPPTAADLSAGEDAVAAAVAVGARAGYPKVDCQGSDDFPVPITNDKGPSQRIDHVIFIVRENKTFDALLGDLPGVEGDPGLTMKTSSADMDGIWTNFRDLARTFTVSDNFYNLAVKSTQGHQWTTYGRTTDFCERTWSADLRPVPLCGITPIGRPVEGSMFEWLQDNGVDFDILGEIVGTPPAPDMGKIANDARYPGGPFQHIDYSDLEKACYTAGRMRVACNLGKFVYMTLPNDHTIGVSPDNPTPETMCAVNDEATGMVIDAISHSPFWQSSLVIITEDDPQQGGDHVDYHRTPLVMVSPWIKRGYVSKTHIDVASLHKLFAHILGLPYPNLIVKNAGLPLDAFTSTPDYTPYTFKPRTWPLACGGKNASSAEKRLTDSWDFAVPDAQPGLGAQVARWMRGKQLQALPPRMEAEVMAREARKARGLPPVREDDDD